MVQIKINLQPAQANRRFLASEQILRYLIGNDEALETLILCKPADVELATSDFSLYEALGSVKPHDSFALNKLTKLLEAVDVVSYRYAKRSSKPILKEERVEELRRQALGKQGEK